MENEVTTVIKRNDLYTDKLENEIDYLKSKLNDYSIETYNLRVNKDYSENEAEVGLSGYYR